MKKVRKLMGIKRKTVLFLLFGLIILKLKGACMQTVGRSVAVARAAWGVPFSSF